MIKKIAFFVDNSRINKIDLSDPMKGNPGIGATQFLIVLIASELQKKFEDKIEVVLFCSKDGIFPENLKTFVVNNEVEAIDACEKHSIELIIMRSSINPDFYKKIEEKKQKTIVWSHNRLWLDHVNLISKSNYILYNVCVGNNQRLELKDHSVYAKTITIFNPNILTNDNNLRKAESLNNIVTYVGNIQKNRGLHILLSVWNDIRKQVPSAELHVVGGSKLYDRSLKTGDLGLGDKKYEKILKKYIFKNNKIDQSIKFHGILGEEKNLIFDKTKVGIINPYGYETLGLSGIEMASKGIPLVTLNKHGQSEIVFHKKSGYLFKSKKQLEEYIVKLLKDNSLNDYCSKNAVEFMNEKFNLDEVLEKWFEIIELSIFSNFFEVSKNKKKYKLFVSSFYFKSMIRKIWGRK